MRAWERRKREVERAKEVAPLTAMTQRLDAKLERIDRAKDVALGEVQRRASTEAVEELSLIHI